VSRYGNESGDSGVVHYEIGEGWIDITFWNGWTYRYTDASAGATRVRAMQALARAGRGLATYVNKYVRDRYAARRGPDGEV
jgi:hypothetical protein